MGDIVPLISMGDIVPLISMGDIVSINKLTLTENYQSV
jgi:hypothetical protein